MHSRRAIRESTIQFLYCADLEGCAAAGDLTDTFWQLALESDSNKLIKASAKTILHLNQGRKARFLKLQNHSKEALFILNSISGDAKPKEIFLQILDLEAKWQPYIVQIQELYQPSIEKVDIELKSRIESIYNLNNNLIDLRSRFDLSLKDSPQIEQKMLVTTAMINRLQRVSDRILMVQKPADFADHPDIKHLHETVKNMTDFKREVDTLSGAIIAQKPKLDEIIESVVENYKPERVDPVDRAILRLGTYEILLLAEIPIAVTINECIEISRRFGSKDSSRFVNGVLDKIAQLDLK